MDQMSAAGAEKKRRPRLRKRFQDLSFRPAFTISLVISIGVASLCFLLALYVVQRQLEAIDSSYPARQVYTIPDKGGVTVTQENDLVVVVITDRFGQKQETFNVDTTKYEFSQTWGFSPDTGKLVEQILLTPIVSDADFVHKGILYGIAVAAFFLCYVSAIFLCVFGFYHRKIERPIHILSDAYQKVEANDLDFVVEWDSEDEFGRLCASFEKMRGVLSDNTKKLWRQMEESRRLTAAFSHDLRTPITVLKGNTEMLASCLEDDSVPPEEKRELVGIIQKNIGRLERYTEAMGKLRRLEDYQPVPVRIRYRTLTETVRETASILAGKKRLEFSAEGEDREIFLDIEIISRCSENVFTNALRYAKESVTVKVALEGDMLFVSVEDDGAGFSQAALAGAINPFFKESSGGEHLGLGLNICHLLTGSHGGSVRLENTERGAKVTLSFNVGMAP